MFRKEWGSWHWRHRMMIPSCWAGMKHFHPGLVHHIQHLYLSTDAWLIFHFQLHSFVYFLSKNRTSTKHQIIITYMNVLAFLKCFVWNMGTITQSAFLQFCIHSCASGSIYSKEFSTQFLLIVGCPCSEDCLFVCLFVSIVLYRVND